MVPVFYPPNIIELRKNQKSIFLAGSIDMGKAINWQEKITTHFEDNDKFCFLNPRRKDWNSSWEQKLEDQNFYEQVNWELDGLEKADLIVFYFASTSKAPISLLELGLFARQKNRVLVCCPEGYWRKGNVDVVCQKFGVRQVESLEELINDIETFFDR